MTIIIGRGSMLSLVLIPFKCPPGLFSNCKKLKEQAEPNLRTAILHSRVPSMFVCGFIFRSTEKKYCEGVVLHEEAGFCSAVVSPLCPTQVTVRGLTYQQGQGEIVWLEFLPLPTRQHSKANAGNAEELGLILCKSNVP